MEMVNELTYMCYLSGEFRNAIVPLETKMLHKKPHFFRYKIIVVL